MNKALALLSVLFCASIAQADDVENSFVDVRLHPTDHDIVIDLEAKLPVGAPQLRSEPGFVRAWFPHMTGWSTIDIPGDGTAISRIRARPGAGDSGVIVLELPNHQTIAEDAMSFTVEGTHARISIARSALPGFPALEPAPPPPAPVAPPVEAAAPAPPPPPVAHTVAPRPAPTRAHPQAAASPPSSTMPWILGLTLVLGAAYAGITWYRSRTKGGAVAAPLRVMASHKLGPRHDLVIVRALGKDHLLSIAQGKVDCLSSSEIAASPEDGGRSIAAVREEPKFGAALLRAATANDVTPIEEKLSMELSRAQPSESVAGLVRLRARAGR